MSVVDQLRQLVAADMSAADKNTVTALLNQWRQVRNWGDSFEITCAARLREIERSEPSMSAEQVAAEASRVTVREATRPFDRAATVETITLPPETSTTWSATENSGS